MATRQEIMREIDNLNKTIEDTNLRKEAHRFIQPSSCGKT